MLRRLYVDLYCSEIPSCDHLLCGQLELPFECTGQVNKYIWIEVSSTATWVRSCWKMQSQHLVVNATKVACFNFPSGAPVFDSKSSKAVTNLRNAAAINFPQQKFCRVEDCTFKQPQLTDEEWMMLHVSINASQGFIIVKQLSALRPDIQLATIWTHISSRSGQSCQQLVIASCLEMPSALT